MLGEEHVVTSPRFEALAECAHGTLADDSSQEHMLSKRGNCVRARHLPPHGFFHDVKQLCVQLDREVVHSWTSMWATLA